ncbi:hypothetical protein FS837_010227 [Tulasnella sp. UAMH 9824]|nr:hypothetical protein FS837_010227 [Tulasnella sp. UAMH 9824]
MSLQELEPMVSQKLGTYHSKDPDPDKDKTVPFLQALFEFAPTAAGQHSVAVDILACATDEGLEELAKRYLYGLILPMRAGGRKTPPESDHTSRVFADFDLTMNSELVEPAKAGDLSTMRDLGLSAFSGIPPAELYVAKINRPENGIALDHALHALFGELRLSFEATGDKPSTYKVVFWTRGDLGIPETVSFVSRGGIPLPDPRYLALHAACAKVAHQSGISKILDKLLENLERTDVLSSDGSSASLLHHALTMAAAQ